MSEQPTEPESNGRATVALVDAKVALVQEQVKSLATQISIEFKELRREIGEFGQLAAKVDGQGDRLLLAETRLNTLERANASQAERRRWRITDLPQVLTGFGLLAFAAAQFFS